jgi:CBS domain containing-hemolysin-like protein
MKKKEEVDTTAVMRINGKHAKYVCALLGILSLSLLWPQGAHASMFKGETLDTVADVLTWIVLVLVPIIGIGLFLMVHILPEKIAEKKQHPQAKAIQTLCLLSLVFGGMLWPFAWLWAYSKPVIYKMAYGTDKVEHGHDDAGQAQPGGDEAEELKLLRHRVAELESKLAAGAAGKGKA